MPRACLINGLAVSVSQMLNQVFLYTCHGAGRQVAHLLLSEMTLNILTFGMDGQVIERPSPRSCGNV